MTAITRRDFMRTSAQGASALAMASTLPVGSALSSTEARAAERASNDKVILALAGAGGRGSGLAMSMASLPNVEFKYVCDPDAAKGAGLVKDLEKRQGYAPKRVADFRRALEDKDVHGLVVATPEHWHALATIWACQAGKDVYVEKNIALTPWESRQMVNAARKYKRIVQAGFQNRSGPYAASARDYIRSGKLGKVVLVKVYNLLEGGAWSPKPDAPKPESLDWDLWLGPSKDLPFNPGRCYGWNDYWDYCAGAFSGDASHQLDLTRMVLGDPPHPKSVYCAGGRLAYPDQREIPDLFTITYDYGDFVMTCESGTFTPYMKKFPQEVRYGTQWPYWPQSATRVEIYGTKYLMYLGRHGCGWQVMDSGGKVVDQDKGYFPDKWHHPNFIDCIRSRKQPNADVELAHHSACLIHLGAISYRVGCNQLLFDAQTERFTNSEKANGLLRLPYRGDYRVPDSV